MPTHETPKITLRDYQEECVQTLRDRGAGRWLVQMATGLGKTVTFAEHIKRTLAEMPSARALILSHREELVEQPVKFFSEPVGIERAEHRAGFERIVSASIQSMANRLENFDPEEFALIILDECHHASATSYRNVLDYFQPKQLVGVTATPNRADGAGLDKVFDEIVFERDILWGISHEYLCPVKCYRVDIGTDLRGVKSRAGDFAQGDLDQACNIESANQAIAEAVERLGKGPTMIFACSVAHAEAIAEHIPGAVALSGQSKDRSSTLAAFQRGDVPCLVNCQLFTEGTDLPLIETLLIARPTQSSPLYCLDEKTEILTKDGWSSDVTVGTHVAAFDIKTEEILWTPVRRTVRRPIDINESFFSIKTQSSDIRVTDQHRMISKARRGKQWDIQTAERVASFKDGRKIPVAGYMKFSGVALSDDQIRFIGWVMTDGSINKANGQITISQSEHQPWCEEIERIIISCGFKFGKHRSRRGESQWHENSDRIIWTISKGQPRGRDKQMKGWGELAPYLCKDFSPLLMEDISEKQFEILLHAINLGDGHKPKNPGYTPRSYHIAKGNRVFIERLQICAVLRGWRAAISETTSQFGKPLFVIHLKKQNWVNIGSRYGDRQSWEQEPGGDEICWCVENDIGTIVTRRNGRVAIVGNCQMVGRGLRLYPGKERLHLIDCVGVSDKEICTAPTLAGIDLDGIPIAEREDFEGDLLAELPIRVENALDNVRSWVRNVEIVNIWAKRKKLKMHDVRWFRHADGHLSVYLPRGRMMQISAPDLRGDAVLETYTGEHDANGLLIRHRSKRMPMQECLDWAAKILNEKAADEKTLWSRSAWRRWGNQPASEKQRKLIRNIGKQDPDTIGAEGGPVSKGEATLILNRLLNCNEDRNIAAMGREEAA